MAMYGRHGESPVPIIAAATPADCFAIAFEAVRIAVKYMTPVILLSDGYLANGAEPWLIPAIDELPDDPGRVPHRSDRLLPLPARRGDAGAALGRARARPGSSTASAGSRRSTHRQRQLRARRTTSRWCACAREKIARHRARDPADGGAAARSAGDLLVLGWGSTYGAIRERGRRARRRRGTRSRTRTCAT